MVGWLVLLSISCAAKTIKVLRVLGELGADINASMQGGFTPAIIAACNDHIEALLVYV